MDHNRRPHNWGDLPGADHHAEGFNPLCGDHLTIYLRMDGDAVREVAFKGDGCAISKASASMMTDAVKGKTREEVEVLFEQFHRLVTREGGEPDAKVLGGLRIFAGVGEFPARVKCATLAWHTVKAAVTGEKEPVTTE
jgi:nitrogen fixation protein NifU and related proteins